MSGLRVTSRDDDIFLNVEKGCLFLLTAAHAQDCVRVAAPGLRRVVRQAGFDGRCGPAGPCNVDGQTAPRDDGHRGRLDCNRRRDPGYPRQSGRGRRKPRFRSIRSSFRYTSCRRRGLELRWLVDRNKGVDESQRPHPDGRLDTRSRRCILGLSRCHPDRRYPILFLSV